MKRKILLSLVLVVFGFCALSGQAFALLCEESQALNAPDACYTKVTLSSGETNLVSQGHALVWNIDNSSAKQGAYEVVRGGRTSFDSAWIAGFAQGSIRSGDSALILVRGFGFVRMVGGVLSGDSLYVVASGNVGTINKISLDAVGNNSAASLDRVAIALVSSTTNGTTARYAYVRVL